MQTSDLTDATPRLRLAPRLRQDSTGIITTPGGQPMFSAARVFHALQNHGVDGRTTDKIIGELMHAAHDAGEV